MSANHGSFVEQFNFRQIRLNLKWKFARKIINYNSFHRFGLSLSLFHQRSGQSRRLAVSQWCKVELGAKPFPRFTYSPQANPLISAIQHLWFVCNVTFCNIQDLINLLCIIILPFSKKDTDKVMSILAPQGQFYFAPTGKCMRCRYTFVASERFVGFSKY